MPRGLTQATNDEDVAKDWWERDPDANIGVVMQPSGLLAFDVDIYHDDDVKLKKLIDELGDLPPAPEQISGSKEGVHLLFRAPGVPVRGNVGGIVLRSKAYIVIAPSVHKSGNEYAWDDDPDNTPTSHLPPKWVAAITKDVDLTAEGAAIPEETAESEWLSKVSQSERIQAMHKHLAKENPEEKGVSEPGKMFNITRTCVRGFGVRDPEQIWKALKIYNARCIPPYDDERLGNIINNVYEKAIEPSWGSSLLQRETMAKIAPLSDEEFREHFQSVARKYAQAKDEVGKSKHKAVRKILDYKLGEPQVSDPNEIVFIAQTLTEESRPGTTDEQLVSSLFGLIADATPEELKELIDQAKGAVSLTTLHARSIIKESLIKNDKGPKSCGFNVSVIFREDPSLKEYVRFNELYKTIEISGGEFANVGANDLPVRLKNWLEKEWGIFVSSSEVGEQLLTMARSCCAYDPVANYLNALVWDRVPRLDTWLEKYAAAQTTDVDGENVTSFVRKVSARWMISAVARALKPGSKVDTVLVLEGAQGAEKSTCLKVLGGAWFTDTPLIMGDKDSRMLAAARWICELAELASIVKSDVETQKAFISASADDFRPPYGKTIESFERRCVFAGTVNPANGRVDYLIDETGDRRWWPVRVGEVDTTRLREDRDQLWAEATWRFLHSDQNPSLAHPLCPGERWWFTRDEQAEADNVAKKRHADSAWSDAIKQWVEKIGRSTSSALGMPAPASRNAWTMQVIAEAALKIDIDQLPKYRKQIAAALSDAGLVQGKRTRVGGHFVRLWMKEHIPSGADEKKDVPKGTN